jgi:peroxiredoxin
VRLLAVTADAPEVALRAVSELRLPFPILSADVETLRRLGLLDPRADIALPAWLVLDEEGRVQRAWLPDSQRTGVSPDELLRSL